jgi:hypothetical protein
VFEDEQEPEPIDPQILEQLQPKQEQMEAALRDVGLYVDKATWIVAPGQNPSLMMECFLGDVAFTKRVQDPTQNDFDASFREMTASLAKEAFEEMRERIKRGEE